MQRRRLLRSTGVVLAGGLAGCLDGLSFGSDLDVEVVGTDGSAGIVSATVAVENTADGPRRGTVVAEVDVSSTSSVVFKRKSVTLDPGERTTLEFLFTNVGGSEGSYYSVDADVEDVHDPRATENVTRRTADSADLGVEVTFTYPPDDDGSVPELSETEYDNVYCPVTRRSAVTPFVNSFATDRVRRIRVTFSYDPSRVPDGDEDGLVLMRFDRQSQEFVAAEDSSVDAEAREVSGSFTHSGIVDVVVFHGPTWRAAIEGQEDAAITTICRS